MLFLECSTVRFGAVLQTCSVPCIGFGQNPPFKNGTSRSCLFIRHIYLDSFIMFLIEP